MNVNFHSLSDSEFFRVACKEVHSHFNRNQNLTGFDFELFNSTIGGFNSLLLL